MTDSPERTTDRELLLADELFAQKEYRGIVKYMVAGLLLLILGTVQFTMTSDVMSAAALIIGAGIIGMNLYYWFTVRARLKLCRIASREIESKQ